MTTIVSEQTASQEESTVFQVTVPTAATAGSTLDVSTKDGQNLSITVPENVKSGETLTLKKVGTIESGEQVMVINREHTVIEKGLGATAAAALIGSLILGPVLGLFCAVATLYAHTREDKYGEAVRSFGDKACSFYEKTVKICNHENLTAVSAATVTKFNQLDEQYKIKEKAAAVTETITTASLATVHKISDLNQQYKITEKVSEISYNLLQKVQGLTSSNSTNNTQPQLENNNNNTPTIPSDIETTQTA